MLLDKETERPFTGEYDNFYEDGTFICRRCNAPLFSSKAKFDAHCGWPSFEESYPNALNRVEDRSFGMIRSEIQCTHCGGHLGHDFMGEELTATNTRHCVNSLALRFIPENQPLPTVLEP